MAAEGMHLHTGPARVFEHEAEVRVLTGRPPLSPVNAGELAEARWSRPA